MDRSHPVIDSWANRMLGKYVFVYCLQKKLEYIAMSAEKYGPQSYFTSNGNDQPAPLHRPNAKSMFPTAPQVQKKPNSEQMGYSQPNPPNNPIDDNPPLYENVSQPHQANPFPQQLGVMTPQYLTQPGSTQQQQQSNVIVLGGQSATPIIPQPTKSKIEFGFTMKCACVTIFLCGLLPGVIACILACEYSTVKLHQYQMQHNYLCSHILMCFSEYCLSISTIRT